MKCFKFKFNKKSITLQIDPDLFYKNQEGWLSIGLQAIDTILGSDVYSNEDKKRIKTLPVYQIFKMLKQSGGGMVDAKGNGFTSLR